MNRGGGGGQRPDTPRGEARTPTHRPGGIAPVPAPAAPPVGLPGNTNQRRGRAAEGAGPSGRWANGLVPGVPCGGRPPFRREAEGLGVRLGEGGWSVASVAPGRRLGLDPAGIRPRGSRGGGAGGGEGLEEAAAWRGGQRPAEPSGPARPPPVPGGCPPKVLRLQGQSRGRFLSRGGDIPCALCVCPL